MASLEKLNKFIKSISKEDSVKINVNIDISNKISSEEFTNQDEEISFENNLEDKINEIESLENRFDIFVQIEEIYKNIDDKIKNSLKNIFKKDNICYILTAGLQEENIKGLWDMIQYQLKENDDIDNKNLKILFELLFNISKNCYEWDWQDVETDSKYDRDKYTNSDNSDGIITNIIFRGIVKKSGEIIKKSFVETE